MAEPQVEQHRHYLLATLVSLLVLSLQTGSSLSIPQFWAEDCLVFYAEAHFEGWAAWFNPYAGYWHLAPRLAAQLAQAVPILHAPLVMLLVDILLRALALASLVVLVSPRPLALILFACALLVPHSGEVLGNASSTQWHLAFVLIGVLLMKDAPVSSSGKTGLFLLALLSALSSPLVVALAPLFTLKLVLDYRAQGRVGFQGSLLLVLVALAGLQMLTAATQYDFAPALAPAFSNIEVLSRTVGRILDPWNAWLPGWAYPVVIAGALAACVVEVRHGRSLVTSTGLLLGGALLLVMLIIYIKMLSNTFPLTVADGGDRYFWVPRVLLLAACLRPLGTVLEKRPALGMSALLILLALGQWSSRTPLVKPPQEDGNWPLKALRADDQLATWDITVTRVNPGLRCVIRNPGFVHPDQRKANHITP